MSALALLTGCAAAGCESPVAFRRPGQGGPGAPFAALGGPAPYVTPATPAPRSGAGIPVAATRPDVYAATRAGVLTAAARSAPPRLYVPNARTRTVDVIDQRTLRVVARVRAGAARVVAGWDLRRLWAVGGGFVPLDPRTGRAGRPSRAFGADGVYFDPSGQAALALGAARRRLVFHDPRTMRARGVLRLPCAARHADFSADGTFLVASCGGGRLVRIDPARREVTGTLALPAESRPGDLRLSPDGTTFHVADAGAGGVRLVDAIRLRETGFVPTGPGARGLVVSRSARRLFVLGSGTVTSVDFGTRRVVARWALPRGGAAEAGGLSADGGLLWLSAPASGVVYALSTRTGRVVRRVKVGGTPRAPLVHPQPGRRSLGGPGLYR
ncbi:hypothetical protein GCM10009678_25960 [Actinomadura kijaniata]|uniref:DNA-binding beta-propeller fold protein YncE n=1 Tax=Actinomadura namibiensis TaxID=182080 RepID=A0A7W3LUT9_ACTNM|nr:hypothetical protein [Actinomadura namibiensis]MBA8954587.1 DNA-binding beta-propeller fold protein YncE [Actinomadura namibiensis]